MDFGDIFYIVILIGGVLFSFVGKAMKKNFDTDETPEQPLPEFREHYPTEEPVRTQRQPRTRKQTTPPPTPTRVSTMGMQQIETQPQPYSEISATEIGSAKEEELVSFTITDEEMRKGIIISEILERKF